MKKSKDYASLFTSMLKEWKWLLKYAKRYRMIIVAYVILGVFSTVMSLGASLASKFLVDTVVQHISDKLPKYVSLVIGLAVFQYVFQAITSWLSSVVGSKANVEIRNDIYTHIVSARWEDIGTFHSGDLLNRLEGDTATVSSGVISFIPTAVTRFIQFFGSLGIVLYYDKTMAILALMSAPFLFVSSRFLLKTIRKYNKQSRELNGKILSFSEESVQNIQVIKAFDLTRKYINNFKLILENYRNMRLEYDKFSILLTFCLSMLGLIVSYSCYGWGIYRLWQGAITYGTMTLFLQISGSLTGSFSALASLAPTAVSLATSAGRIMEVTRFEEESDADRENAYRVLEKSKESGTAIIFDNVTFCYCGSEMPVLKNISFEALPGDTVALIGPSGEGKTTLLKLILGIVKPTSGRIYFRSPDGDSVEVSDSTRRFCSYVPQDVGMFSGTVAENLRLVCPDADDEMLENALGQADIYSHISSLPDGINTVIGEGGANFSQGQLQRIAIARAVLRDAPIMLMDETTSALDMETEKRVLENIMTQSSSKIRIITTHRESMLRYCNRIYKIGANGEMVSINKEW